MVRGLAADASWRRRVRARRRHVTKALLAVLVMAIGIAAIVLGEGDDSPGLQPLGVLFVLGAVVLVVRAGRRRAG
jgi:drug/metabolite transporter (DMT)-like permease